MNERHDQTPTPVPERNGDPSTISPRPLFGDDAALAALPSQTQPPLPPAPRQKSKVFSRIVVPVAVFIVGVAAIAWVSQYLPSQGRVRQVNKPDAPDLREAIQFEPSKFIWDADDKDYKVPEFELGADGHFDYRFSNTSSSAVELGVAKTSCTCSGVQVCVFQGQPDRDEYARSPSSTNLKWTKVEVDEELRKTITIPGQASGALRIAWKGPRFEPEVLLLNTRVWTRNGKDYELYVLARYVHPARFTQERVDLGAIGPKDVLKSTIHCWSSTSDLDIKPNVGNKALQVEVQPLSAEECKKLQTQLRADNVMTRVRSAAKIIVTLHENHDGKQLDLGLFNRPLPLSITANGQPVKAPLPMVRANVLGDVDLAGTDQVGRIDLSYFKANIVKTKKVTAIIAKDAKLSFVACDPVLLDLDVELRRLTAGDDKSQWELAVSTKPNRDPGALPENGVVVLELAMPAAAGEPPVKRLLRIPVIGVAERSSH